ncbi:MAG: [FeFe] hydrogenase H-cluster radical SAM maturase HydG [Desulfuromonadales bacterium C00003107]|jgi:2-iminoacetate synthase|nr:MAG: [FeFe] hydrogenase H-cluster radical SAM maturase HydG [Desulfuromonadales bacterium C00003107]
MDLSKKAVDFIDEDFLHGLINKEQPTKERIREIVAKSLNKIALSVEETADLVRTTDPELHEEIFAAARQLKENVYGNRIVLFAPLYIGNDCINDCTYCAFKRSNFQAVRRTLTPDEIKQQVTALEDHGHKRLILVFGEHTRYDADFIADTVRNVYSVRSGHGEIRRVNINAAPLDTEGYKKVKDSGIGTYQIFMETYHHDTYTKMHPGNTRKGNYLYRLDGLNRAFEAGIDDVGLGVLFGLYDWRFEVLAMVRHALYLQERYNVGPHTLSFPRLRPAQGVEFDEQYFTTDDEFKRIIAILRLAVPYTGLILTARENPELRRELMSFGVSQIDAGSRIELGGYTEAGDAQVMEREQFSLADIRSLDEVMCQLMSDGYVPSFCTSCYRSGRTGEHFMEFSVPGFIKRFCTPNALLTLQEYLADYGSTESREVGEKLIAEELAKMEEGDMKQRTLKQLEEIKQRNVRDIYF